MLDMRLIREQPDLVRHGLARVGADSALVDRVLELDAERRRLETEGGTLKNRLNTGSKQTGAFNDPEQRAAHIAEMRSLGDQIKEMDARRNRVDDEQSALMLTIPNLPAPGVPDGQDESENVVTRVVGEPRRFDFVPLPHWEIGARLGILDIERGIKISGSRFYVLKGAGAALQRALIAWFLDLHTRRHGYTEVYPPAMVREQCMFGTGQLPKFGDNLYRDIEEDYYWIPTAEVPVTNLHRDEILEEKQLPLNYVAYTPCFRREKMSAGRDVRGIKRGHQFDKVEMVKLVQPEDSDAELLRLLDDAEDVCRGLQIPHRVIQMCAGDLSFTAAAKYDVELWAPGSGEERDCRPAGEWLEVSSCSSFRDFQARRMNLRFRREGGGKPEFVHTLNGSGLALPRVMIAVLENYQNADGSVAIPEALRPYMHGENRIAPA